VSGTRPSKGIIVRGCLLGDPGKLARRRPTAAPRPRRPNFKASKSPTTSSVPNWTTRSQQGRKSLSHGLSQMVKLATLCKQRCSGTSIFFFYLFFCFSTIGFNIKRRINITIAGSMSSLRDSSSDAYKTNLPSYSPFSPASRVTHTNARARSSSSVSTWPPSAS
jgi:hypothetical protein